MMIEGWLRSIMFAIEKMGLEFIDLINEFIYELSSNISVFKIDFAEIIASRVYAVIGIFMVLRATFSLLNIMIDPDKEKAGNKKAPSKVFVRIVVVMIMLVVAPIVFYELGRVEVFVMNTVNKVLNISETMNTFSKEDQLAKFNEAKANIVKYSEEGEYCVYVYKVVFDEQKKFNPTDNLLQGSIVLRWKQSEALDWLKANGLKNANAINASIFSRMAIGVDLDGLTIVKPSFANGALDMPLKGKVLSITHMGNTEADRKICPGEILLNKRLPKYVKNQDTGCTPLAGLTNSTGLIGASACNNYIDTVTFSSMVHPYKATDLDFICKLESTINASKIPAEQRVMSSAILTTFITPTPWSEEESPENDFLNCYYDYVEAGDYNAIKAYIPTMGPSGEFILDYKMPFSTIAVVIVFLMMLTAMISIVARMFKLYFLEMFAPIPIVTLIEPSQALTGDSIFGRFIKQYGALYVELYIRLITFNLIIMGFSMATTFDISSEPNIIKSSLLIFGLLVALFAIPIMFSQIFKFDKDLTKINLNPFSALAEVPVAGVAIGAAIGAGTGAIAGGISGYIQGGPGALAGGMALGGLGGLGQGSQGISLTGTEPGKGKMNLGAGGTSGWATGSTFGSYRYKKKKDEKEEKEKANNLTRSTTTPSGGGTPPPPNPSVAPNSSVAPNPSVAPNSSVAPNPSPKPVADKGFIKTESGLYIPADDRFKTHPLDQATIDNRRKIITEAKGAPSNNESSEKATIDQQQIEKKIQTQTNSSDSNDKNIL